MSTEVVIASAALVLGLGGLFWAFTRGGKRVSSDPASVPAECVTAGEPKRRYDRAVCCECGREVAITASGSPIRNRHRCAIQSNPERAA